MAHGRHYVHLLPSRLVIYGSKDGHAAIETIRLPPGKGHGELKLLAAELLRERGWQPVGFWRDPLDASSGLIATAALITLDYAQRRESG